MAKFLAALVAACVFTSTAWAAEIPKTLQGTWSSSAQTCEEDMPNGIVVLDIAPTSLGFYEIGCSTSQVRVSGAVISMKGLCTKGGSTKEQSGKMQIRPVGPNSISLSYSGYTFMADARDIYYRCRPSANAAGSTDFTHNGSLVSLAIQGSERLITYSSPRPGMSAVGVKPGDILFSGAVDGSIWKGKAAVFNKVCGRIEYPVTGSSSENGDTITLVGEAPRMSPDCHAQKPVSDTLVFKKVETAVGGGTP